VNNKCAMKAQDCKSLFISVLHFHFSRCFSSGVHKSRALTLGAMPFRLTYVDGRKVQCLSKCCNRSRLGDQPGGAIRRATRPEKTSGHCEVQLGFGTAKAVIASGAVTVHASTLLTPSQELAARA
jgi:hypothetical protein